MVLRDSRIPAAPRQVGAQHCSVLLSLHCKERLEGCRFHSEEINWKVSFLSKEMKKLVLNGSTFIEIRLLSIISVIQTSLIKTKKNLRLGQDFWPKASFY